MAEGGQEQAEAGSSGRTSPTPMTEKNKRAAHPARLYSAKTARYWSTVKGRATAKNPR